MIAGRNAALTCLVAIDLLVVMVVASAAGFLAGRYDHERAENWFSWEPKQPLPYFVLVLGRPTWETMTTGVLGDFQTRLRSDRVHRKIVDFVITGMRHQEHACPVRWLLDKATELPDGSALFVGHCSADYEGSALDPGDEFKVSL